jgi:hypothetical protein
MKPVNLGQQRDSNCSTKASQSFSHPDGICDMSFGKCEVAPAFYQWLEERSLESICDKLVGAGYDNI